MSKILFLTAHPVEDPSCRYRVLQFLPYLEGAGHQCTVSSFSTPQLFTVLRRRDRVATKILHTAYCTARRAVRLLNISRFDFVVIHREAFPFLAPMVENWILRHHPNVIFSFDDAIYAGHADVSSLNHPWLYRLKYGGGYQEVIKKSCYVIAGNRTLAEYARKFNSRVEVIPTVVDCARYSFKSVKARDNPITIGWIGSRSTISYVLPIEPALQRVAKRYGRKLRFRFVGYPDYRPNVPEFESLPFSLDHELSDLHAMDIGIMPLPDTEWTRGKCAFKAIQYMASGVATVASPVGMTTELIQHGKNGLLAASVDDWFNSLQILIADDQLRRQLSTRARQTIEEGYSLQTWSARFVQLIDRLASEPHLRYRQQPALTC